MKKSLNALLLLGVVLAVGNVTMTRARGIDPGSASRQDRAFVAVRHLSLRYQSRSRLSRGDGAVFAARVEERERFAGRARDQGDARLIAEERLKGEEDTESIRDPDVREARAVGIATGERLTDSERRPGEAQSDDDDRQADRIGEVFTSDRST